MVVSPKHLSDLAKIEADVRIRCRECGFEEDWTIESLGRHLLETHGREGTAYDLLQIDQDGNGTFASAILVEVAGSTHIAMSNLLL